MTDRLSLQALARIPDSVRKPAYPIAGIAPGIVHLGAGAFHRAHQAVYTDDVLNAAGGDWGITAVSMRRPDVAAGLRRQDGLYAIAEYDEAGQPSWRVIGAIREALVLTEAPADVAAAIGRAGTQVVTLTVTEKAYHRAAAAAGLDLGQADVKADLAAAHPCRTAVGALVAGLQRRRETGAGPLSVVCCDNLSHNGPVLRRLCGDFADAWRPGLAAWMDGHVSFPSTMVDRITPAATDDLRAAAREALGCIDQLPVGCEAFSQWVIEDDFAGPRPPWDLGGAQFVSEVEPFEVMKLRLLNASHSALAYLGLLAGKQYVAEAATVSEFRCFLLATMARELAPTVKGIPAAELRDYQSALLRRFSCPRPAHRLAQIAEDGSQKIPIRVLAPLREQLAADGPMDGLVLIVAAWLAFVERIARGGLPGPLKDPLADRLLRTSAAPRASDRALALGEVFGADLPQSPRFLDRLDYWRGRLEQDAVGPVMHSVVTGEGA
jgi:fructuronate reductase